MPLFPTLLWSAEHRPLCFSLTISLTTPSFAIDIRVCHLFYDVHGVWSLNRWQRSAFPVIWLRTTVWHLLVETSTSNDWQGLLLSSKWISAYKSLSNEPRRETDNHSHPSLSARIDKKLQNSVVHHFLHKLAMLLLQLFSLALLTSEHVASVLTEAGFRLSVRDDECNVDDDLSKRVACTQPVQCDSTHYFVHFIVIAANHIHSQ